MSRKMRHKRPAAERNSVVGLSFYEYVPFRSMSGKNPFRCVVFDFWQRAGQMTIKSRRGKRRNARKG